MEKVLYGMWVVDGVAVWGCLGLSFIIVGKGKSKCKNMFAVRRVYVVIYLKDIRQVAPQADCAMLLGGSR